MRRATRWALAVSCVLGVVALAGAGCYESLTSMVTADKLVFYDDLVGTYKVAEPATGRIRLSKGDDGKSYVQTHFDEKGVQTNKGTLHILKLGDAHFYEVTVDAFQTTGGKLVYAVGRLEIGGKGGAKTLTGYSFKSKDKFFADAAITTAEFEYEDEGETRKGRALSMPAEKLQAYFASHAKEMTHRELHLERVAEDR